MSSNGLTNHVKVVENTDPNPDSNREKNPESNRQPNGQQQNEVKTVKDKSLWLRIKFENRYLQWAELIMNPLVTFGSLAVIIIFVGWSMNDPKRAATTFKSWKVWIGHSFTWLYIGSQDIWGIYILYIFFSKYSSIRLGQPDSRPEFGDGTWFAMLFSCGVSTGLFFFGVAEPVRHYTTPNRYSADPTLPDNQLAQDAILITLYHWGLHGWVVYTIIGLVLGLMAHREGLPMTMKSCFYPLIGDKIFGWPGDLIDILSVIATMFGVCTSLGLGTIQINQGMNMLNTNIEVSSTNQVIIIWAITSIATISVVTGVKGGIKFLSEFCFSCGCILMLVVLFLDQTVFLLNLYTQSLGHYFQWLLQIGFHSDAFEQLGPSYGAEDRGRYVPPGYDSTDGPDEWMNGWTIFYWGWWIAWCPFVGMFIAKISYGRTIKEFIIGTMAAPVVYIFMWMIIFGGAGLRMEREAARDGLCCHNINTTAFLSTPNNSLILSLKDGSTVPIDVNMFLEDIDLDAVCKGNGCNSCSEKMMQERIEMNWTVDSLVADIGSIRPDNWGLTTTSRHLTRLSCRQDEQMWFDLVMSYGDLGPFLSGFSLMSLILYFVTSSDSGSLVIDCLASNGYPEPPALQRIVWALIEGLTATALLVAGKEDALYALQSVSIATGLVYTILMCIACVSLWRAIKSAAGESENYRPNFKIDVLEPLLADPFKDFCNEYDRKTILYKLHLCLQFFIHIFTAPISIGRACALMEGPSAFLPKVVFLYSLQVAIIVCHSLYAEVEGIWVFAWIAYIMFCIVIGNMRSDVRSKYNIPGSPISDFLLSLFLYPSVALQIILTLDEDKTHSFDWRSAFKMNTYSSKSKSDLANDEALRDNSRINTVFETDNGIHLSNIREES